MPRAPSTRQRTVNGNGGKVVVWSDQLISFAGLIKATGGALGGNGGFVETSSHGVLSYTGTADVSAAAGTFGTLLLDPFNVTITSGTGSGGSLNAGTFTPTANDSALSTTTLTNALATANVVVTTGSGGTQAGNITVTSPVTWSSASSLTLSAYNNVVVNASISNTGGANVILRADNTGTGSGTVIIGGDLGRVSTSGQVSVFYNPSVNPAGSIVNTTSYVNPVENYAGRVSGGGTLTAYMLVNTVYDLQNVQNNLGGTYALGRNIDASATVSWNSGAGFVPIGTNLAFNGIFDGQYVNGVGPAISNLTIAPTDSNANNIGLFALNFGTIQNLHLTNVSVTANPNVGLSGQSVGALAGQNYGTISNVAVDGTSSINGGTIAGIIAGGLVGQNGQTITQSRAGVSVTLGNGLTCTQTGCDSGVNDGGGLVGLNYGSIDHSSASGYVSGGANNFLGGLAGWNAGGGSSVVSITSSFATGNVASSGPGGAIGGLVGQNWLGSVTNSYATGAVNSGSGSSTSYSSVGGLVGFNAGNVNQSYATGPVTAGSNSTAGGLVGGNYNATDVNGNLIAVATISGPAWNMVPTSCGAGNTCYAGIVTVGSGATGGGLVGSNQGSITNAFAIANVTGAAGSGTISQHQNSTTLGGLVGRNSGQIINSFATGAVGSLTTAALQVGGLVGSNQGTISGSFANAVVSAGDNSAAGGLAGSNGTNSNSGCNGCDNTATITNSNARGNVTAGASSIAGGLVGVTAGANGSLGGGSISNTTAYGAVAAGSNSFVGGLAGVAASTISSSSAQNTLVASTGSNSIVGGLVGFNAGLVTTSSSTTPVSGVGNSFIGGFIGINVGTVTQSTVDPAVTGTGNNNFIGGIAGLNVGSIDQTSVQVALTGGAGSLLGGIAGVNGTYTNFTSIIPNSSFPTGTITNSTASGTGFSSTVGSMAPVAVPAVPAWVGNCTAQLCTILANGTLQTAPLVVNYSVANASSTYGTIATVGAVTLTGVLPGSTVTATVEVLNKNPTPVLLTANTVAGSYTEIVTALSNPNYTIASSGNVNGTLTINPATLTYTANAASRTYGAANPVLNGTVSGFVAGDTLASATTGSLGFSTAATPSSNVGSYASTGSGVAANNGNYVFTQAPANATALTINPASITVTALGGSSTYGGLPSNPGFTATGLQNGQGVSVLTGLSNSFGITNLTNAGSYALSVAGTLTNPNYTVTSANAGTWAVNPAALTYVANAASTTYGGSIPTLTGSVGGFVNGQTLASATTGTLGFSTAAAPSSNVGSYAITGRGLAANNGNYVFVQAPANATAFTITPASLVVNYSVANASSTYGTVATVGAATLTGVLNGDTVTPTVGVFSGSAPVTLAANTSAGSYIEKVTALSNSNYTIASSGNVNGTLTINPATLTYTANAASRTYGAANPVLNGTVSGFVAGDTLASATTGSLGFSTAATPSSNVGSYASTGSGLAANNGNYVFTQASANATALTINPASITVTALGGSSTYGGLPSNPGFTATGLQNGQGVSVLTGLSNSFGITNLTNAGSYTLSVAGTNSNTNYAVTTVPGSWTVNSATLTYVANAASSAYGAAIPTLTGTVSGFVNGQTLASTTTGTLGFSTAATPSSNAGSYAVTGSGLTATNGNYVFTQAPANADAFAITPVPPNFGTPSNTLPPTAANIGTQQLALLTPPPTFTTSSNQPLFTPINLGPRGSTGGTGGNGGTGGTGGTTGGPGDPTGSLGLPTGSLANGRQGGNGAPLGTRLIDLPVIPLPPGSGLPPPGETRFVANEVVAQFGPGVSPQDIANIARQFGLTPIGSDAIGFLGRTVYRYTIPNGQTVQAVIRAIEARNLPVYVQPEYNSYHFAQEAGGTPAAADQGELVGDPAQYVIGKFHLGESHRLTKGDNVVIAVIDSEIDASHPDLAGVVTGRYDAGCGATVPDAHGTGMTGAIAARKSLMGVAPNVKVIAVCAFGGDAAIAELTSLKIIKGLDYAIQQGARVINMSFAGPRDPTLAQALQIAREKGILLVGAAGNAGPKSPPLFPGRRSERHRGDGDRRSRPPVQGRQSGQLHRGRRAGRRYPGAGAEQWHPAHHRHLGGDRPCVGRRRAVDRTEAGAHAGGNPQNPGHDRKAPWQGHRHRSAIRRRASRPAQGAALRAAASVE